MNNRPVILKMLRVPWISNLSPLPPDTQVRRASFFFELLDVYRTLLGIFNLTDDTLPLIEGRDLSSNIVNFLTTGKVDQLKFVNAAFSQVRRCGKIQKTGKWVQGPCSDVQDISRGKPEPVQWMAYSVRTDTWRYTVWLNAPNGSVSWDTRLAEELYQHQNTSEYDYLNGVLYDTESYNLIEDFKFRNTADSLFQLVQDRFLNK